MLFCVSLCLSLSFFMSVLLFPRICMMVVLGCTHCLLPTKRVTDDTESVGGGRSDRKTFTEKKIPIYILFPSLSFEPIKAIRHNWDSGHFLVRSWPSGQLTLTLHSYTKSQFCHHTCEHWTSLETVIEKNWVSGIRRIDSHLHNSQRPGAKSKMYQSLVFIILAKKMVVGW